MPARPPRRAAPAASLVIEVDSAVPLPAARSAGGPTESRGAAGGVYERFLHVDGSPVLIRAWELRREARVAIAAMPAPPAWLEGGSRRAGASAERARAGDRAGLATRSASTTT